METMKKNIIVDEAMKLGKDISKKGKGQILGKIDYSLRKVESEIKEDITDEALELIKLYTKKEEIDKEENTTIETKEKEKNKDKTEQKEKNTNKEESKKSIKKAAKVIAPKKEIT